MTSPYTAVNEVRTTLRDDLIAARALINTLEKWEALRANTGSAIAAAFYETAGPDEGRVTAMFVAVIDVWTPHPTHAEVLAILDRAIASAESSS